MTTTAGQAETVPGTPTTPPEGTPQGQEQQEQQQSTTVETTGQEQPQAPAPEKPAELPDDHPLVKTLAANKTKIAGLNTELAEARSQAAKATQLEADLAARPTQEALDTLQTRYDRLEAFTQAVGLGKALDSRTFTKDLFETDKDIADLVKEWNRTNPTATSTALGAGAAAPEAGKTDINALLRAASK